VNKQVPNTLAWGYGSPKSLYGYKNSTQYGYTDSITNCLSGCYFSLHVPGHEFDSHKAQGGPVLCTGMWSVD